MKCEERTKFTMDKLITCDTEIMSGTLVFKKTRVPVKNLIDYLETGESLDDFLEDFPSVSREQVVATLELAGEILLDECLPKNLSCVCRRGVKSKK